MKNFKFTTFITSIMLSLNGYGQNHSAFLDYNNVSAMIMNNGSLFYDIMAGSAGYEVPAGSNNHLIFQGAFWFGGTNENGDLKLAAHAYGEDNDYSIGPYSSTGEYMEPVYFNKYNSGLWWVERIDIINHINNHGQQGYVTPSSIMNWPGNGDTTVGVAHQLAPYVDVDSNGVYEPHLGDYPCINGDKAIYQIMNDDGNHTESGGEEIGAEIHIMAYQYVGTGDVNNTTFIETKVINRGQHSFEDFKATFFLDTDIGFATDDYIGSAPSNNMAYSYNASAYDPGGNGSSGYGANPPAVGVVLLNKNLASIGTYYRTTMGNPSITDPQIASEYWNYMNAKWKDGSDWTQGGIGYGGNNGSTQFLYDGNPNQNTSWSEMNIDGNGTVNPGDDRVLLLTSEEETFQPGEQLMYNYAIVYNNENDHLNNVDNLITTANNIQTFFDTINNYCASNTSLSIDNESELSSFSLYPNPTKDQVHVKWTEINVKSIQIISFQGKTIKSIPVNQSTGVQTIDLGTLSPGVYFVEVGTERQKIIVQ
ncbi:T9SS type A sorting domain-containing protein [Brumimicrobium aurantiacum]|uniref:T9SS C-terminal target domain-containing protein n=1 Tax=Brumimicrobium aurantiacum TaxID=1737063 RepID=A0A3E1F188_9FLAO|nr:T9SS type A sorting domain-containing protein [Brumimicrobium aurantiacum]RFC55576.1 T9SS C-terminal target domain-containing protein [Brumimicrobium aurantiacum]